MKKKIIKNKREREKEFGKFSIWKIEEQTEGVQGRVFPVTIWCSNSMQRGHKPRDRGADLYHRMTLGRLGS